MFQISEADHAAISDLYGRDGMVSAALELRCRYPEIENQSLAVEYVRSLVIWKPLRERGDPMATKLLQFFAYAHLPPHLQAVSRPFSALARRLEDTLPSNAEKNTAMRRLLEAKDCAVRAVLFNPDASS